MNDDDSQDNQTIDQAAAAVQEATTAALNEAGASSQDDDVRILADRIMNAENILVALPKDPSVDTLSAALGLTLFLDHNNKHVTAIYSGKTPNALEFLRPEETFQANTDTLQDFIIALDKTKADHLRYQVEGDFVKVYITPYKERIEQSDLEYEYSDPNVDLVISVDVNSEDELDEALTEYGRIVNDAVSINITAGAPGRFADNEFNDINASSTSELMLRLIKEGNLGEISGDVATAFLTGIMAATERFTNTRVNADTMSIASDLMKLGADQQRISVNVLKEGMVGDELPEPELEPETEPEPATESEPEPEAKPESEAKPETEAEPAVEPEPEVEVTPVTEPASATEPVPAAEPALATEPVPLPANPAFSAAPVVPAEPEVEPLPIEVPTEPVAEPALAAPVIPPVEPAVPPVEPTLEAPVTPPTESAAEPLAPAPAPEIPAMPEVPAAETPVVPAAPEAPAPTIPEAPEAPAPDAEAAKAQAELEELVSAPPKTFAEMMAEELAAPLPVEIATPQMSMENPVAGAPEQSNANLVTESTTAQGLDILPPPPAPAAPEMPPAQAAPETPAAPVAPAAPEAPASGLPLAPTGDSASFTIPGI